MVEHGSENAGVDKFESVPRRLLSNQRKRKGGIMAEEDELSIDLGHLGPFAVSLVLASPEEVIIDILTAGGRVPGNSSGLAAAVADYVFAEQRDDLTIPEGLIGACGLIDADPVKYGYDVVAWQEWRQGMRGV